MPAQPAAEAPSPLSPPGVLVLAGPTAVGKSELALLLAERFNAEIVSVDSMQVYRGLDIGTAKPSAAEKARVPHHLVDVADLAEPFDAARFVALAAAAVEQIRARGKLALLCGGTGLYFKAFLEGLGEAPPASAALRAELRRLPASELLRELAERDPVTFARIDQKNPRRVLRAVEVLRLTGRPISVQRAAWTKRPAAAPPAFVGLVRANEDLRRRIDARVEGMFRTGLVEETRHLLASGLAGNIIALQALGYRQVAEYLHGGRSLEDTRELVKARTRQFAKRQLTWFRRQLALNWVTLEADEPAAAAAEKVARFWAQPS